MAPTRTSPLLLLAFSACLSASALAGPATAPTTAPAAAPITALAAAPATAPSTRPAAEVEALIKRLSADDARERQKAEDQLVAIGQDAVPALRKAAEAPGEAAAERRARAAAALARIEQIAANGPTIVTLHFKDVSPKVVLAELSKQAKAPIKVWPEEIWDGKWGPKPANVTIDVDKQPFWLALAAFCDQVNVRPQEMGFNQGITLMQGGSSNLNGPRCISGRFVVVATGAQRQRVVQYGPPAAGGGRQDSDALSLQVYVDPRAKVVGYSPEPEVTEAVDDKGNSLGTRKAVFAGTGPMNQRPFTFSLSVPLHYPDDGYTKLSRLKGSFNVVLASSTETLEIADLEKAVSAPPKAAAGVTVEVKQAKVTEHGFSYKLHVHRAGLAVNRWRNLFGELQGVRITDAQGHSFEGGGGGSLTDRDCNVENTFNTGTAVKGPLKLVWEMTTETKRESIPFELKDLPLPTP